MAPPMKPSREEMLAVTMNQKLAKQGAKTRKLAEARDVNTMPDPKTYAAVMGMLGTPPNEMGFSAMHPQYKEIMDVAEPAFYAGTAAQLAPLVKPVAAGVKAAGKMAGQALNDRLLSGQSLTPGFNTPAPIMHLDVWHGTPHKFAPTPKNPLGEFDPTKIGTGEGAQAFGHGHYLAEAPKVAQGYRDKLSVPRNDASEKIEFSELSKFMGTEKPSVNREIKKFIDGDGYFNDFVYEVRQNGSPELQNMLLKADPSIFDFGHLYKVDLADKTIPKMLDWDRPLSEQSDVIKALKGTDYEVGISQKEAEKIADARLRAEADDWAWETGGDPVDYINNANWEKYVDDVRKESGSIDSALTGKQLHELVMRDQGYRPDLFDPYNYQVDTSEALRQMGIPGIKYLDHASRDAGKGTRNFVVFPGEEESLNILERKKEGGEIKATPVKNKEAHAIAKALDAVHGFASKPFGYNNPPGEMISDLLGIPATARTLERIGYGEPLTTGKGMTAKPKADTMDALMSVAPLVPITKGMPVGAVIKQKNANWRSGEVEKALKGFKRGVVDEEAARRLMGNDFVNERMADPVDQAMNKWIDSNLTNYVKKQMATPDDPVRKLAEQGITFRPQRRFSYDQAANANAAREHFGGKRMAESHLARQWENDADTAFNIRTIEQLDDDQIEPWMLTADRRTPVYGVNRHDFQYVSHDFGHIIDVLREDLASGRIRPEQLNKISMEQAVRRTYEYDQELAKKMAQARIASREGLPVHKEYPEGYRWVELNKPGAFASESEAMGHSVRGYEPPKGHADWVEGSGDRGSLGYGHGGWEGIKSGRAKVYSLVDPKGEPHVTVEVGRPIPSRYKDLPDDARDEIWDKSYNAIKAIDDPKLWDHDGSISFYGHEKLNEIKDQMTMQWVKENVGNLPSHITQIKGKQNAAPKEEYLPYVQDFVRGGQWSDVRDLQNTGLFNVQGRYFTEPELTEVAKKYGRMGVQNTPWEVARQRHIDAGISEEEALRNWVEGFKEGRGNLELPPEGMKRGGEVKMGIGGLLGKGAIAPRMARAPAKTPQEIEAIAERMAPQVLGQYVRESEKSAKTVAGKTKKQFEREKTLPVDIRANKEQRKIDPIDFEKFKENVVIGVPGDPTVTAKTLHGVGDVTLESAAPQHGGPLYGLYSDDANFWASGIGPATRVQNLALEAQQQYDMPVLGKYIMMGSDSSNYAQHFADANLQAIDLSRMSKAQIEKFNQLVRRGSIKSGPRPSFPGIEDKDSAYLHMAIDPELRKHFNALMQQPTVTEPLNMPSGIDIRFAITEPELRNLEIGSSGYSIGRMRPDIRPEGLKLSEHPTYSHDIPGQFMGGTKYPVPYELSFPDTVKAVRENPTQAPQEFGSLKMVGPRQVIDQQFIDEMKKYEEHMKKLTGKKKGGAVQTKSGLLKVKRKK